MANVTEIPELVKTMYSLFGEKWGKRLGRLIVLLILGAVLGGAILGLMAGIRAITSWAGGLSPNTSALLLTLIGVIILVVGMIGIGAGLGTLIGMILRAGLAIPMHRNIDVALEQTEAVLLKAKQSGIDNPDIDKLLSDLRSLKDRWTKSRITRVASWIIRPVRAK
jgi:uncharacterized protein (DUF697 family)